MGWQDAPIAGKATSSAMTPAQPAWARAPIAGAAMAPEPAPQTDEMVSAMFGLKREPSGQTYFEAPPELPEDLNQVSVPVGLGNFLINKADDFARPVLGGIRNAVVGAVTAPADIVSALGSDVYQPVAEAIRQNVPQVRQQGTGGEIMQAVTQYAPPAVMGAGLVNNPVAKMGMAALADMLVTDPSQASTVGDLIGGPTAIQPQDSPATKRVKVGAETAAIEPVASLVKGGVGLAKQGYGALKEYAKPFTKTGQEEMATKAIKNLASDPAAAVATIDKTAAALPQGDGFKPLTGEASMDPGLIRAQKALANTKELGDQTLRNESNVAQQFKQDTAPGPVDRTPELRRAVEGEAAGMVAPARQQLETSNKALAEVETQLKSMAEDTARSKGGKTAASENIDATFREVNDNLTKAKNELFRAVDPDGTLKKDGSDFVARVEGVKLEEGQAKDALPSEIVNDVASLKENGNEVSFRFLVNMRQRLSDEIGAARAANQGARVDKLLQIKTAVNDEINSFAQGVGAEDAARLGEAFDFYADTFAPTLKEGQAGKMRQAVQSNRPGMAPASATASKFLSPGMGQKERAQSLKKVLAQAETPEEGLASVRNYLISDMAENVTDGTAIKTDRLTAWTDKNREVLKEFPEVRREIAQLQNRVRSGSAVKKQIEQDILTATEGVKRSEKEVANSALATIMKEDDPVKAVSTILGGANKRQRMRQIITAAKKDSSGQAMEGLKDAVRLYLRNDLTQSTPNFEGDALKPSFAKLVAMQEKNPEVMGVLEDIYGAGSKEIQSLKQIRTKLEILSRKDRVQGTTGSPTKGLEQNEQQFENVLAATLSQNFKQNRIFSMVARMLPSPAEGVRQLVTDALVDPELAKTMLMKPTPENLPKIELKLRTYITNNILGSSEDRSQDNQENDSVPETKTSQ